MLDPVIRFTTKGICFNSACVSKLPGTEYVEFLFNPVERMIVIRPCSGDHPNAIKWEPKYKSAAPLCKVIYDSMGWDSDYSFRVPCQVVTQPNEAPAGHSVLFFDLDNFIGRASDKKDEAIIQQKVDEVAEEQAEDAKSFFYPPDAEEPQEITDMEEKFQQAVELNRKIFGTPVFQHNTGIRDFDFENWDMMTEAQPLDITHTVDTETVDNLLVQIMEDPPPLPQPAIFTEDTIVIDPEEQEG